ncbi:hypothetical protein RND71_015393 [Anisodus tanguticus]|uniref:DUF3444 domain-containing protein n=1 Tax=Anisodus tanguticus TaxID=243964 RepID=A0AAE1S5S5_9SOLA|nr:hypothetical protein RND71_015393 [Anisodus tanguticus]
MSAAVAASRTSYIEKKDVENKKQTVPEVITNDLRRDKAANDAVDRTEKSFDDNQLLASHDDDDGMPRYYAMIHKAI